MKLRERIAALLRKPGGQAIEDRAVVLTVNPSLADRALLSKIFEGTHWELIVADKLEDAIRLQNERPIPIVLCDRDLTGVDWRFAIRQLANQHCRVFLASFVADDYLWDEVIRHGGYDIVAKPYRAQEVLHTIEFARAAITKSHPSAQHIE
jgi:DNA-binding NtrC family response regulator